MSTLCFRAEKYWKQTAEDLAAFAAHAGRKTINEADVQLLMTRLVIDWTSTCLDPYAFSRSQVQNIPEFQFYEHYKSRIPMQQAMT